MPAINIQKVPEVEYRSLPISEDLLRQKSMLQREIVSIQEEIEILLLMLDRDQDELDQVQARLSGNALKNNVTA